MLKKQWKLLIKFWKGENSFIMKGVAVAFLILLLAGSIFYVVKLISDYEKGINDFQERFNVNESRVLIYNNESNKEQGFIECAKNLYYIAKEEGMIFDSQCLGACENYAVDIVHVPRISEDDLFDNQCEEFREGKVSNFIEIDKNGEIVRIFN